ncbi:MAG: hypothetical protein AD742_19525 [Methylibium sp. NZG]|nr:MAG: hypothetical protein AD742_19525 [Methylibium sp. NZG]
MDPTYRLRIATRLHFLLLRRYGQDIEVSHLLKCGGRNHDGLWLCKATGDDELIALARLLAHANQLHAKDEARLREHALMSAAVSASNAPPAEMPWSFDTSGFGLTHPLHLNDESRPAAPRGGRRFNPLRWLKRREQRETA